MENYKLGKEAEDDLARLYEYGVLNFGLKIADGYFEGLIKRLEEIGSFPLLHPAVDYIRSGYRLSIYKSHAIYYKMDGQIPVIVRILGRQNLESLKS
jgi:toxin ParE1/3/4